MNAAASNIRTTLEMIKIEHTLFALPFAFLGAVLAARGFNATGLPTLWQALWITLAMVGARSAAMAFNRIADREYDAQNPRTAARAIPAGRLSVSFVWMFTLASAALFFVAASMLNRLTLALSPVALGSVVLYSYTKRFTSLSHVVLGWCLCIAPTGAWVAVRGSIDSPVPLLLSLVVLLWTAGFDVLYACQDYDFDRRAGLRSIPARVGVARALWVARVLHAGAFAALVGLYFLTGLGSLALAGVLATGVLLVYQHSLVRADDLSRLNAAFFTTNAFVSVILLATFGGAVILSRF
ncbi:MAG: 4-hydroxybenzoate polyprenyltransferase [Acidobacteriota bacterium]|jgi:4-hydroxybenzoate polyprenyltransferase|nr:4-hydroxybenzoate polyprenyltransferase [Acidobacteriota bacterium]MDT5263149.1 4-hydroxybenzoate polyprenyltransferase [Acidobacteriota bacterium]